MKKQTEHRLLSKLSLITFIPTGKKEHRGVAYSRVPVDNALPT